jgi:GTPase SAR1 family protein
VFGFLTPAELCESAGQVCRRWRDCAGSDFVWRRFASPLWRLDKTDGEELPSFQQLYVAWARAQAARVRRVERYAAKQLKRHQSGREKGFFEGLTLAPSYAALRNRYALNLLVVGSRGAGKHSLVEQWCTDAWAGAGRRRSFELTRVEIPSTEDATTPTTAECQLVVVSRTRELDRRMIEAAHAVFVCYSSVSSESLRKARERWLPRFRKLDVAVLLVGLKADLVGAQDCTCSITEEGEKVAREARVPHHLTSAKDGLGLKRAFTRGTALAFARTVCPADAGLPDDDTFRRMAKLQPRDAQLEPAPQEARKHKKKKLWSLRRS